MPTTCSLWFFTLFLQISTYSTMTPLCSLWFFMLLVQISTCSTMPTTCSLWFFTVFLQISTCSTMPTTCSLWFFTLFLQISTCSTMPTTCSLWFFTLFLQINTCSTMPTTCSLWFFTLFLQISTYSTMTPSCSLWFFMLFVQISTYSIMPTICSLWFFASIFQIITYITMPTTELYGLTSDVIMTFTESLAGSFTLHPSSPDNITTNMLPLATSSSDNVTIETKVTTIYGDNRSVTNAITMAAPRPLSPRDFVEYSIAMTMYKVTMLTVLVLGTPCNLLSLAVMLRKSMRSNSSSVYFAVLAIWDTLTIWSLTLTMIARFYLPGMVGKAFCKLLFLWQGTASMCSAWTVVAMTFERMLVVTFPLKAIRWCTVRHALITLGIIAGSIVIFNTQYFATGKVYGRFCVLDVSDFVKVWSYIDGVVSTCTPVTLVIVCNVQIVRRLRKASAKQQAMTGIGDSK